MVARFGPCFRKWVFATRNQSQKWIEHKFQIRLFFIFPILDDFSGALHKEKSAKVVKIWHKMKKSYFHLTFNLVLHKRTSKTRNPLFKTRSITIRTPRKMHFFVMQLTVEGVEVIGLL